MASDQPASVLTDSQREFLKSGGETDNDAHDRAMHSRIRKRVRTAVLNDIPLVLDHLEPEGVFDPDGEGGVTGRQLTDALPSMVALAYRLADAAGIDPEETIEDGVKLSKQSRAEYLLDVFHEDPGLLTLAELELLRDEELIDELAFMKVYHGFLESIGIEIPEAIKRQVELAEKEGEESVAAGEELDKYGTGVKPRPSRPDTDE